MLEINIGGRLYDYDKIPDHCPICHHGIHPINISGNSISRDRNKGDIVQILYRCPRQECQQAFIASYRQEYNRQYNYPDGEYTLRSTSPYAAIAPDIPEEITKLSPDYENLMAQSSSAEHYQLDQIAGVGYRKALEYLIKDYAIHKSPEENEKIKSLFLGNVINDYVDDKNVQECAKRAAWLGNDETHYIRKWEEKDINDLKILIKLTEAWITNNLLTEKYMNEMQK